MAIRLPSVRTAVFITHNTGMYFISIRRPLGCEIGRACFLGENELDRKG